MTTLAERAKGTAFEILYTPRSAADAAKAAADKARTKIRNDRNNALRKAQSMAGRDNRQRPNWTI